MLKYVSINALAALTVTGKNIHSLHSKQNLQQVWLHME